MAQDVVVRIRTEGGQAAGQGVREPANALRDLAAAGSQSTAALGQLGTAGNIVGAALGGGAMVAGIMAVKAALDFMRESAQATEQQLSKLTGGGTLTTLSAMYGPGAAKQAAFQGAQFGLGADISAQARAQVAGTLGTGLRTEQAVQEVYRLGALGFGTGQASTFIGGLMASDPRLSATGASNLFMAAQTRIGPQGAEMLPQIVGVATEMGIAPGEALAFTELMTRSGVSPSAALATLQNLGGGSPEVQKILKRAGVTEGMGLGQTLQTLSGANLSAEDRRAVYGRGLRGIGSVMANLGEFGEAAGAYSGAAASRSSDAQAAFERLMATDPEFAKDFRRRMGEARMAASDMEGSTEISETMATLKWSLRHPVEATKVAAGDKPAFLGGDAPESFFRNRGTYVQDEAMRNGQYEAGREADRRQGK